MPFVSPATVVTQTSITTAWGNSVKDAVDFLANPPSCRVYNGVALPTVNNTDTTLTFNSERWDTASMHSTAALTSRLTAPVAGLYLLYAAVAFASNATGFRTAYFLINGGNIVNLDIRPAASGEVTGITLSTTYKLAANDYVELVVKQTSGGALNVQVGPAAASPEFGATWIGLG